MSSYATRARGVSRDALVLFFPTEIELEPRAREVGVAVNLALHARQRMHILSQTLLTVGEEERVRGVVRPGVRGASLHLHMAM